MSKEYLNSIKLLGQPKERAFFFTNYLFYLPSVESKNVKNIYTNNYREFLSKILIIHDDNTSCKKLETN